MNLSMRDRVLQRMLLGVRPALLGSALKKALGVRRSVVATSSGRFYVDPVSALGATLTRGTYEPTLVLALWALLEPRSTFLDVGANEGYFSVIAAKLVGPNGRVVCVEPQRRIRAILEKNLELNHVTNTRIVDAAISDSCGAATLHISPDTNTGSTALRQSTVYPTRREQVDTITLSKLFDTCGLEQVDLMKLDIEGFEYEAILGSPDLFREQRIRALALELHGRALAARDHASEDIIAFLKNCNYRMDPRFPQTLDSSIWVASR